MPRHTKHRRKKNHPDKQKTSLSPNAISNHSIPDDTKQSYLSYLSVPKGFLASSWSLLVAASKLMPTVTAETNLRITRACGGSSPYIGSFSGSCYDLYVPKDAWCNYAIYLGRAEVSMADVCGSLEHDDYCLSANFTTNIDTGYPDIHFLRAFGDSVQQQFEDCVVKLIADAQADYMRPVIIGLVCAGILGAGAIGASVYCARNRIKSCWNQRQQEKEIEANVDATSQDKDLNEKSPLFLV
jgi:hypothetical protein